MQLFFILAHVERIVKTGCASKVACMSWSASGRAIIIRNEEVLTNSLLPSFFPKAKFSSFTRKLYRWGFRQDSGKSLAGVVYKEEEKVFWHPHFQRDNRPLVRKMKSSTAEGRRRTLEAAKLVAQQSGTNNSESISPQDISDPSETTQERPNRGLAIASVDRSIASQPFANAVSTSTEFLLTRYHRDQHTSLVIQGVAPSNPFTSHQPSAAHVGLSTLADWQALTRPNPAHLRFFTSSSSLLPPNPILSGNPLLQLAGILHPNLSRQASYEEILRTSGAPLTAEERLLLLRYV